MKLKSYLLSCVIVISIISSSCNNNRVDKQKTPSVQSTRLSMSGKVYRIGPELDSSKTESFGSCDCCTSELAFLNDSMFVVINECQHNNGYFKGIYETIGDTIKLKSDSFYVSAEVDEDLLQKHIEKVNLEIIKTERSEFTWVKFNLNNKECFKTNMDSISFATPQKSSIPDFLTLLKSDSDSIPGKLNLH